MVGKGWHLEPVRHSRARRFGSAGGKMPKKFKNSKLDKTIFGKYKNDRYVKVYLKNHQISEDAQKQAKAEEIEKDYNAVSKPEYQTHDAELNKYAQLWHEKNYSELNDFQKQKIKHYLGIEKEKDVIGNPKDIISSLWIREADIENYDDGRLKGRKGLINYLENGLKNNPEDSTYPKKLREYHKSVIKELKKERKEKEISIIGKASPSKADGYYVKTLNSNQTFFPDDPKKAVIEFKGDKEKVVAQFKTTKQAVKYAVMLRRKQGKIPKEYWVD
jgi:hypothetical protein